MRESAIKMFKKIKMPKMPKLNIVSKANSVGTSIKDSTKNMAKSTVKGVKGLNPFKK